MTALTDILTAHRGEERGFLDEGQLWCATCKAKFDEDAWPAHVEADIQEARIMLVELPEPVVGMDWDWCVVLPPHPRDGVVIDDLVTESGLLTAAEARSKAAALLAAAVEAERAAK